MALKAFVAKLAISLLDYDAEKVEILLTGCTAVLDLFIQVTPSSFPNNQDDDTTSLLNLTTSMTFNALSLSTLVLIKKSPTLDISLPIAAQIQLITLPGYKEGMNPYEAIHKYIHNAVTPYFEAFTSQSASRDEKDSKAGVPSTKRKLVELELSLLHLQHNVGIPEITLQINPLVAAQVKRARLDPTSLATQDFIDSAVSDAALLNKLQEDVNSWIKELQKVTKLDRDPAAGTASQEINFWLSLDKALMHAKQQLESQEIILVLDILKQAKRFHATVSFMTDTGLKEAMDRVAKYNVLCSGFPLNELLSSTSIAELKAGVQAVFSHLNKKLKVTPYPIERALRLVESISSDFNQQLITILASSKIMHQPNGALSAKACQDLFFEWDEQVRGFQIVARDLTRKRSERFIPIKVASLHALTQERIKYVGEFRALHASLQATIEKILKVKAGKGQADKQFAVVDASTLAKVKLAYQCVIEIDVLDTTACNCLSIVTHRQSAMKRG